MKKALFTLLIMTISQLAISQTLDSLQGTWRFESVYHPAGEAADSSSDKGVARMFASMAYEFKADDEATLSLFNKEEEEEEGTYTFKAKKNTIVINVPGKKVVLEIIAFEGNRMAVKFSTMQFWLKLE